MDPKILAALIQALLNQGGMQQPQSLSQGLPPGVGQPPPVGAGVAQGAPQGLQQPSPQDAQRAALTRGAMGGL